MREIKQIIIHCSATSPSLDIGAAEIRLWHLNNGWSDIGYNYVIRRDGVLEKGRDLDNDGDVEEEIGAHAKGFNTHSIGICLVGGTNSEGKPDANFTFSQYVALKNICDRLSLKYPQVEKLGHRDLAGVTKACPCFDVREFLDLSKYLAGESQNELD